MTRHLAFTRHLTFDGIENFRDYGDYAGAGGRRLKRGMLYRSAAHAQATDADLEKMAALNLAAIVDLRRKNERERAPSRRPAGFAGRVIFTDEGDVGEDPWQLFLKQSDLSAAAFRGYMLDYYDEAPFVDRHVYLYSAYFKALAGLDGPVLIHCAAGKDRTGILAALTHHIAGVGDDDIRSDFLLTNNPERLAKRLPMIMAAMTEATGRAPTEGAVMVAMSVEEAYLERAFAAIKARHGSIDAYLEQALGVDAALRERLEARLLD
ncbi:MAG TPA: tyrosine-protein phosphatase [Caulobacteraceae bacterium]